MTAYLGEVSEPITLAARFLLAVVLISFSALKLRLPKVELKLRLSRYRIIPMQLIHPIADLIVPLEMTVGFMLLANILPVLTAWTSLLMFTGFTLVLLNSIARGQMGMDCGCGVPGRLGRVGYITLGRNTLLLFASLWLVISLPR